MNKLLKGSIAGAAGIALLLGGAGTLALWNDSETITGGTITAGNLDIAPVVNTTDGWKSGTTAIDLATYKIVPGATITYTKTFNVTAVGTNMTANVALGTNAITAASTDADDVALATLLTKTATITVNGTAGSVVTANAGTTQPVVVTVAITFPNGGVPASSATGDNAAKNGQVSLNNFAVTLTQTGV